MNNSPHNFQYREFANNRIFLDANESSINFGHLASSAISSLRLIDFSRYQPPLKLALEIANRYQVDSSRVVVTAGAEDALARIFKLCNSPCNEVVFTVPTFPRIEADAKLFGSRERRVYWLENEFPLDEILENITTRTSLVVIVSPSNPGGRTASFEAIKTISEKAINAIVLLDFVYCDFTDEPIAEQCLNLKNAVSVFSFSKSWGLAGLRIGFAIAHPEIALAIHRAGSPFSISTLSSEVTLHILLNGEHVMKDYRSRIIDERAKLQKLLKHIGIPHIDSQSNFVLCRSMEAERIQEKLMKDNIFVKSFFSQPYLNKHIRISLPGDAHKFAILSESIRKLTFGDAWPVPSSRERFATRESLVGAIQ